jgi:hypothetical protein
LTRLEGNHGQDTLTANYLLLAGSTGRVGADLFGGTNLDHLGLFVRKENPADPVTVSATANGGQFLDFLARTGNVHKTNAEFDRVVG